MSRYDNYLANSPSRSIVLTLDKKNENYNLKESEDLIKFLKQKSFKIQDEYDVENTTTYDLYSTEPDLGIVSYESIQNGIKKDFPNIKYEYDEDVEEYENSTLDYEEDYIVMSLNY